MNNNARSIKTAVILAALALGLAQFFVNLQPQAAAPLRPAPVISPISCTFTSCSVDADALVGMPDRSSSLTFNKDGVILALYDTNTRLLAGNAVITPTGAVVPIDLMTSNKNKPCVEICPGTCTTDEYRQVLCNVTFAR